MAVNKWLFKKIRSVNNERMNKHLDILVDESGKSRSFIKFDIIRNFIVRGSGYTDYFRGNYINLTKAEKETFVTAKKFYNLLEYLNDSKYKVLLNDKLVFYIFIITYSNFRNPMSPFSNRNLCKYYFFFP